MRSKLGRPVSDESREDRRVEARKEDLLAQIADERTRLAALDRERDVAHRRLQALQTQLAETTTASPRLSVPTYEVPTTAPEKVRLFRSLFRGRAEVFPTRFVSKKTGKPGYAPEASRGR